MKNLEFRENIKNAALGTAGISAFLNDWVQVIDSNNEQEYPAFLKIPSPKTGKPFSDEAFQVFDCTFYIFDLRNNKEGLARDDNWNKLANLMDAFLTKLLEDFQNFALIGDRTISEDEGSLGVDDLLWVKCTCKIRAAKQC